MSKFVSFLESIGRDFKKGIDFLLTNPYAVTAEKIVIGSIAPELLPTYNVTKAAVVLAEQNFAAIGKQSGTGTQKSAAVIQVVGGLIKQGLADAGLANDEAGVQKWVDFVVTGLKAAPAIATDPAPAPAPAK
jgi:hypothetical protein